MLTKLRFLLACRRHNRRLDRRYREAVATLAIDLDMLFAAKRRL